MPDIAGSSDVVLQLHSVMYEAWAMFLFKLPFLAVIMMNYK